MTNAKNKNKRKGKCNNASSRKLEKRVESEQKKRNNAAVHAIEEVSAVVGREMFAADVRTSLEQNEFIINVGNSTISLERMDSQVADSNYITAQSKSQLIATIQVAADANKTEIDSWSEAATRAAATTLRLLELFGYE